MLNYRPVAAAYSKLLDRLVMISAIPNQVHIYDPATKQDSAVTLSYPPSALALSEDGRYAAVGHSGFVSWVDLQNQSVVRVIDFGIEVKKLAVATGYIYALPTSGIVKYAPGASGSVVSTSVNFYDGNQPVVAKADGSALYVSPSTYSVARYDVGSTGTLTPVTTTNQPASCGGLWLLADTRLMTGCGIVLALDPVGANDLGYRGSLNTVPDSSYGNYAVVGAAASTARNEIALIPYGSAGSSTSGDDGTIRLFEAAHIAEIGRFPLPPFVTATKSVAAHGQFVAYTNDSSKLVVLSQADAAGGLLNDFGVAVFDFQPRCAVTLASTAGTPWASGSTGSVQVNTSTSCIWEAVSNASWITITANSRGRAGSALGWYAAPNPSVSSRSGTVTIGSQTYTITQPGRSAAPDVAFLPYRVVDSRYSKAMDRLVLLSNSPNQVHVIDANIKLETLAVNLLLPALALAISPDGLFAAVAHNGWISRVNLQTGAVEMMMVPDFPSSIAMGSTHIYTAGAASGYSGSRLRAVQITTGIVTTAAENGAASLVMSADGNSLIGLSSYGYLTRWKLNAGLPILSKTYPGGSVCAPFTPSADGLRLFDSCGQVFRLSEVPAQDLTFGGSLTAGPARVSGVAHLAGRDLVFVTSRDSDYYGGIGSELFRYSYTNLDYVSRGPLPNLTTNGTTAATVGAPVFGSADESRLHLVLSPTSTDISAPYALYSLTPETQPVCTYAVTPTSLLAPQAGGGLTLNVTTSSPSCSWNVTRDGSWLGADGGGRGSGTVRIETVRNDSATARSGAVTVAGIRIPVTQASTAGCRFAVPASITMNAADTSLTIPVEATSGCAWNTTAQPGGFGYFSGSGVGNGSVYFYTSGGSYTGTSPRSMTVTIAGQTVTITQLGTNACTAVSAVLTSLQSSVPAEGKSGQATLTFSGSCAATWSVTSLPTWIQIFPVQGSTSGTSTISYTIFPTFAVNGRLGSIQITGVRSFPVSQNANSSVSDARFVGRAYFAGFGRAASLAETNFQITNALNRGVSRADFLLGFLNSPEFNAGGRFVAGLYVGLLDRDAEFGGWSFQRNAMVAGAVNQTNLVTNFLGSAEWIGKYGTPSDAEFVRLMYRNIFRREASQAEVDFQAGVVRNSSRIAFATQLLNSREFQIGTGPRLTAFLLYGAVLGRNPSTEEMNSAVQRLSSGIASGVLLQEILDSFEFSGLVN